MAADEGFIDGTTDMHSANLNLRACWTIALASGALLYPLLAIADAMQAPWNDKGYQARPDGLPAPTGCGIAVVAPANGTLPPAGGDVSLWAACATGPVTMLSWRRDTLPVGLNGPRHGDTLPANPSAVVVEYVYALTACNADACAAPVQRIITVAPVRATVASGLARRDFNADGRSDILWRNAGTGETRMGLMNGASIATDASLMTWGGWEVLHTPFLDGDGHADLLWYSFPTGTTAVWSMRGRYSKESATLLEDPARHWRVALLGDFNGDDKSDLVWNHAGINAYGLWLMDGGVALAYAAVPVPDSWDITHVGDFDGNGRSDLVFRHAATGQTALWLMNGTSMAKGAIVLVDAAWAVELVADFNGDGKADLLWRNASTGQTALWIMDGTAMSSGRILLTDSAWMPTHAGDFNGDGKADLLWRNGASGQVSMWLMDGTSYLGGAGLLTSTDWSVRQLGDFNGDGKSDLLWHHAITGHTALWLMNGTSMGVGVSPLYAPAFKVQ